MKTNLRISIVTPSYNQDAYLERTLLSVLDQGYPDLEYIVMDGASTDNSIKVIQKFENKLAHWKSEKDDGQAHAINKGLRQVTGDIVAWINSDDLYEKDTFLRVAEAFHDERVMWVTAPCRVIDDKDTVIDHYAAEIPPTAGHWLKTLICGYSYSFLQPSTFWRRSAMDEAGLLNEQFHYSFDHEFFYRLFREFGPPRLLEGSLSMFRLHSSSKTSSGMTRFRNENRKIGLLHVKKEPWKNKLWLYILYLRYRLKNG